MERYAFLIGILLGFLSSLSFSHSLHTIQQGDTLWSISRKYQVSVKNLSSLNPNISPKSLRRGNLLKIPKHSSNHSVNYSSSYSSPNSSKQQREYQVQHGDTLWNIARKFQVNLWDIQKLNSLSGISIRTGQIILLPKSQVPDSYKKSSKIEDSKIEDSTFRPKLDRSPGIWLSSQNSELRANEEGKVIFIGFLRGYGSSIFLEHPSGRVNIFSSRGLEFRTQLGTRIQKGQLLGTWKKNPKKNPKQQFFFQVWKNSRFQNPKNFVNSL